MKKILFTLMLLILVPFASADEDVCCIFSSIHGELVQTYVHVVPSVDCKGNYQGKKTCMSIPDPDNMYCSSESSHMDRCKKCGYFWTGSECNKEDPFKKIPNTANTLAQSPPPQAAKAEDPDNPDINQSPEDDSLYNNKPRKYTKLKTWVFTPCSSRGRKK